MAYVKPPQGAPRRSSPVTTGLLAGIFIALVVLVIVVFVSGKNGGDPVPPQNREKSGDSPKRVENPKPESTTETLRPTLKSGQSKTREAADQQGLTVNKPSKPMPQQRVQSTYAAGKKYRSIVRFEMKGRGKASDWGVTVTSNFVYFGEMQITRDIHSNDGNTIVLTQRFDRAQNVRIATQLDNIEVFNPGATGEVLLMFVDWAGAAGLGLHPGWSEDIRLSAQLLADTQVVKDILSRVAEDQTAKVLAYLDSLQGKSVKLTYVNGEGVKQIEPIDCELSSKEQDLIFASAILSDTYVLPDPDAKVGESWTLLAGDVLPFIDPSLHAQLEGSVSAKRGNDQGTAPNRKAVVEILAGGQFDLRGFDRSHKYEGSWRPIGNLVFSFADNIVTEGTLGGRFELGQESTDHWIFKASFVTQPTYEVRYTGVVLP